MSRHHAAAPNHTRAALFLFPALFSPTSTLRAAFHRLRGVSVGHDAEIGYDVMIDNLYPEKVRIGDHATVATRATILAHDESFAYAWGRQEIVTVTSIEDGAFIGAGALILPGVKVGMRAIVGAGSVVSSDVPENAVVAGVPARVIRMRDP